MRQTLPYMLHKTVQQVAFDAINKNKIKTKNRWNWITHVPSPEMGMEGLVRHGKSGSVR